MHWLMPGLVPGIHAEAPFVLSVRDALDRRNEIRR